jgi:deferrochelatase/peroxidase EfeB
MKDNNYPGSQPFSREKSYRPPFFSNREFEQLISTPPLMRHDPQGFANLLSDLQANILAHHQRRFSRCFFLHFNMERAVHAHKAIEWLAFIGGKLTRADKQFEEIGKLRRMNGAGGGLDFVERAVPSPKLHKQDNPSVIELPESPRMPVVCLYLSWEGYVSLGLEPYAPFDEKGVFEKGMHASLPFLFGENAEKRSDKKHTWHAMLLLASDLEDMEDANNLVFSDTSVDLRNDGLPWVDVLIQDGKIELGRDTNGKKFMTDWFRFRDGISQPRFFPDLYQKNENEYKESELAPLRVALVKDKGGRKRFSAGSFMAYLKIRQDITAFENMENTIAAHIAVFGLETLLAQFPLKSLVPPEQVEKLLELNTGQEGIVQAVIDGAKEIVQGMLGNKSENIREKIAVCIAGQPLGKTISINPDKKAELLGEILSIIRKMRKQEDADKEIEMLVGTLRKKILILKSEAEKLFAHTGVIEQMLLSLDETRLDFSPAEREIVRDALHRSISIKSGEKRELIDGLREDDLPQLGLHSVKSLLQEKMELAGAYIVGRFRNGTPVATHPEPGTEAADFNEDFRYNKKLILKNDESTAIRHEPDGALESSRISDASADTSLPPFDFDDLAEIITGREKEFPDASRLIDRYRPHAAGKEAAISIQHAPDSTLPTGKSSADDLAGMRCPFAAHVRKTNPRDDRQNRVIVRRGVLYEDETPADKGMLFMSFQANLTEQFEYILRNWINSVNFGMQMTGVDLLAGTGINREYSRWYFPVQWNGADPDAKVLLTARELPACIHYLEGGYFFAPAISFLESAPELSIYHPAQSGIVSTGPASTKPVFDGYPVKPVKWLKDNIM